MSDGLVNTAALANAVYRYRTMHNLSLRDMALRCDISFATLARIENGNKPSLDAYIELCRLMGYELEAFVFTPRQIRVSTTSTNGRYF